MSIINKTFVLAERKWLCSFVRILGNEKTSHAFRAEEYHVKPTIQKS